MDNRRKNLIYSLVLLLLMASVWAYRSYMQRPTHFHVAGTTMGVVPYNVKYIDPEGRELKAEIDSLLKDFNQSLSTYIPDSEISRFNRDSVHHFESGFFYPVLQKSQEVYENTDGAFDPTVMPLVRAWGFGPGKKAVATPAMVDSLLKLVGFYQVHFNEEKVWKSKRGVELDFSAIAKGYAVDLVGELLQSKGIEHYMVEIGGEVVANGLNEKGNPWTLGIDNPDLDKGESEISAIVQLQGRGLATSGNYRNYYNKDGKKLGHTIDPKTGHPVQRDVVSASVFAKDCMTADAYATAFMEMGKAKSLEVIERTPELDVLLIYEEDGKLKKFATPGVAEITIGTEQNTGISQ